MNKDTKYKGVVIEATPEQETTDQAPASSRVPLLLALLIVLALGAACCSPCHTGKNCNRT